MQNNTSDTIQVIQCRVTNDVFVNYCYLVINTESGQSVAVDPAWEISTIEEYLSRYQVDLCGVLITHHHSDHIDLAPALARAHDCSIYMSNMEYIYYNLSMDRVVLLDDGIDLTLGGITVHPIITPGHTAGSTCYLIDNALFTGDTLFNEGTGVCSAAGGDPVKMFRSMQLLKENIRDDVRIYPGHRYYSDLGTPFGKIKKYNIYLQIRDLDQFVKFRMRENKEVMNFS